MHENPLQAVYDYHQASKHRPERYAPGPGGLDWATQPDPFRVFQGSPYIDLPLGAERYPVGFTAIRAGERPNPAPLDLAHLAILLELSLGLSAWKSYGESRWALRCNPSSGNLHPTECYLVTESCPGLEAGVYHYLSRDHRLEQRAVALEEGVVADPAMDGLILGLASITWREAWKYGLRAYRYCQHDVGHAVAAVVYAAAVLGWRVATLTWGDGELATVLGLNREDAYDPNEPETADLALWVGPTGPEADRIERLRTTPRRFLGTANQLSPSHRDWTGIATVLAACERPPTEPVALPAPPERPPLLPNLTPLTAAHLIRQRRSAVDFDARTRLPSERWFAILDALLPRAGVPPLDTWPRWPRVHLVFFVHRIEGIDPGLYLLARDPAALPALCESLRPDWRWEPLAGAPAHLPLQRLILADAQAAARGLACHQDIAADSCFAVSMLAGFDAALREGPWHYPELFWECGLLGQILYLEAEAAGVRGTGIGCFFDDAVHDLLGIRDTRWQALYHFTVGAPVEDTRLRTDPPYQHLAR